MKYTLYQLKATFYAVSGAGTNLKEWVAFFVVPLHFFGSTGTGTISCFGGRFRDGQCSLVSFFAVLLLMVPLCQPFEKSGGTCPRVIWSRRWCMQFAAQYRSTNNKLMKSQ